MPARLKRAAQLAALSASAVRGATTARGRDGWSRRAAAMGGLPQKIAQIFAFDSEAPPSHRTATEVSVEWDSARTWASLEEELGPLARQRIAKVDPGAIRASLGQVHRAQLVSGHHVALKIQYPAIKQAVEVDLQALGLMASPIGRFQDGFDVRAYRAEIGARLREELDYTREADALRRFAARAAEFDDLVIPTVFPQLSTQRLLTMGWCEGDPLETAVGYPRGVRLTIARTLIRVFLRSILTWREVHADPHPGNYRFSGGDTPTVTQLDFGCVRAVEPQLADSIAALLMRTVEGRLDDAQGLLEEFVGMGFEQVMLEPFCERLPALTKVLLEPFSTSRWDPGRWHPGVGMKEVLGEHRMAFRLAGSPSLIYVIRAFHGLVRYLQRLGVVVDSRAIACDELARWASQRTPLRVESPRDPAPEVATQVARHLRVKVVVLGRTKAEVTFPARAVASLPDLMPDDVAEAVARRGIFLDQISQAAIDGGLRPDVLFELDEGARKVKVWLE